MKIVSRSLQHTLQFLILSSFGLISIQAQTKDKTIQIPTPEDINYTTQVVVADIDIPWGMVFLPDGSMLITDKSGKLIHSKKGKKTMISGVPSDLKVQGQGGLLDIELHPNYEKNGWIYLTYSSSEGEESGANTKLIRAKLSNNSLTNIETLYKAGPNTRKGQHFGSRIEFDNQGFLYFSIGDRGNRNVNPQDVNRDGGKIYRLKDDGSIPEDNPFVNKTGAKKAIFSYGHRNPQGMVKHPLTGEIWVHEHGPRGGDEINIVKKGANFGWPKITYGINYSGTTITKNKSLPGMEQPLYYWIPSIAPSGMTFVTSSNYPDWRGDLLVGSLVFQYLELVEFDKGKVSRREKLLENIGRVRNVRQGPDGFIYVAVEGKGILKIAPKSS
ncbi:PQQ-dependent sugar dehydrogenase [Spongiivirga citrea]|uniref:PQQ-dependent sugar dehydrogenase n=1 Tax=Spongiivirga citrea TaxID=1481457 RepID=A0A6M0CE22_9FLAO|nr:PQQ-dependent sugar dehydrogenase [Spongiivirga citrea]NER15662.1 PQQ-dependent sugar dehydrogenase [Spongiivirga citrea]